MALAALLAVDAPQTALAEDPAIPHTGDTVTGAECDITGPPPSHSGGAACWKSTHGAHRRLDHYEHQELQGFVWVATQPRRTQVKSCERNVVNDAATDHGMAPTNWCDPNLGDGWPDPADPNSLRWKHVETEYAGSGHNVVWHQATTGEPNVAPVFQPATILQSTVTCCGRWTTVATLRALDADVVQVSGVWQDDLRFSGRSSDSVLGVSRLTNARYVAGGGGQDVDVQLSGLSPGTVTITVDVRDLRDTATDTITIGPFTILPDSNQAPTVSISGATVTEGERAVLTITSSVGGGSGSVQYRTVNGTATAPSDFRPPGAATLNFSGPGTNTVIVDTVDDSDVEGTESFTVELFGESGVDIGTGAATVTILDNDSAPDPCPAGQTGTPPNCVPIGTPPCPAGQTGTPPNCVPIVVPTGCDAPGTSLSALTVIDDVVDVVSGFDPGTYSYAVTIVEGSARIEATAADSQATLVSGSGVPGRGSISRTTYLNVGGTSSISVRVASAGQSCTYTLSITRSGTPVPVPSCPAWSGTVLVDGVCVPACWDGYVPNYDANGQAGGCIFVGDCPFSLWGYNPSGPFGAQGAGRFRDFAPRWLDGAVTLDPVAAGGSASTVRHAVKCKEIFRYRPWSDNTHRCSAREVNLHPDGDCLRFRVSVEAVVPGTGGTANGWEGFVSSGCGNASAPDAYAAGWTADDYVCLSSEGSWTASRYCGSLCSTEPAADVGVWSVTMGDLTDPLLDGSTASPYVDVPLEVEVSDWGDVSELEITVVAIGRHAERWYYQGDYGYDTTWPGPGSGSRVVVPRRSGPAPSDDVVQVNIAEISQLGYRDGVQYRFIPPTPVRWVTNRQFVDILRDDLLANDACPAGADCTDPNRWPVRLVGGANVCNIAAFQPHIYQQGVMQRTELGLVGCSDLDETGNPADPASVQYWPRLWATGTDQFSYSTYGGEATVTVEFTDQPPAGGDITVHDPGVEHTVATMESTSQHLYYVGCQYDLPQYCWNNRMSRYTTTYGRLSEFSTSHYAGAVPLSSVFDSDPDGDVDVVVITDGHNPHLTGQSATRTASGYSQWRSDATSPYVYSCQYNCSTLAERQSSFNREKLVRPVNPADGSTVWVRNVDCVAHTLMTYTHVSFGTYYNPHIRFSAPSDTDPGCIPSVPDECASLLADWVMCYELWPNANNPAPLVVDYRACDARLEAAADHSFAVYMTPLLAPSVPHLAESQVASLIRHRAEGNSTRPYWLPTLTQAEWDAAVLAIDLLLHSRYCSDGTITVLLGDSSTVSLQPSASSATEGARLQFEVVLDTPAAVDVAVSLSVMPDTAGADPAEPSDYDLSSDPGCRAVLLPVTIPAGQDRAAVQVCTVQDSIHENDETLLLEITSATGARLGTVIQAVGTITNDDPLPEVTVADVSVGEDISVPLNPPFDIDGDGIPDTEYVYGETLRFTVTLAGSTSARPVTVSYDTETTPGTATSVAYCQQHPGNAAEDYRAKSGTLTFSPGDTSETITVTLCPDDQHEPDETLIVTLSSPTNATLGTASATGTIVDNDVPPLTPLQQCELLHGPGWAPVLYPDDTPWTGSGGQIVCAMPH